MTKKNRYIPRKNAENGRGWVGGGVGHPPPPTHPLIKKKKKKEKKKKLGKTRYEVVVGQRNEGCGVGWAGQPDGFCDGGTRPAERTAGFYFFLGSGRAAAGNKMAAAWQMSLVFVFVFF